jgi:GAF domain-containing protein
MEEDQVESTDISFGDRIDLSLSDRNDLISFRTEEEKKTEKKIAENVVHIKSAEQYENLARSYKKIDKRRSEIYLLKSSQDREEIRNNLISIFGSKKKIVDNALEVACNRLKCQTAAIFLLSSKNGYLERVGIRGIDIDGESINDDWFNEEAYEIGGSLTGKAAEPQPGSKYGKTCIAYDLSSDELKNQDQYRKRIGEIKAVVAIPLNGRNKTYGVLRIINKIGDNLFSEDDIASISFLAGAVAAAISNFHRDAQNNILRFLKDSVIASDCRSFNDALFYKKAFDFLIGSETAFKAAILRVRNDNTGDMEVRFAAYAVGISEKKDNHPRRSDQGFVGLAVGSHKPQIVEKITESGVVDKFMNSEWVKENKFESFICFPLLHPETEEVIGTLALFAGYESFEYEFHSGTIAFLNDVVSSLSMVVKKEKVKKQLEDRFSRLVMEWRKEAGNLSSTSEAVMHPAYQQIIGLGKEAIPLLLKELNKHSGRWFWALKTITGENPVSEDQRGKNQEMINAWIDWGKKRGYITEE